MKKGFKIHIEDATVANTSFRKVLYTASHCQVVLMSLKPGEDIGMEIHPDNDQFFRFEQGTGKVIINETSYEVADGDAVVIPAGAEHNVVNTSEDMDLRMYTIYSPAHHKDSVERVTKAEVESDSPEFDGVTTE